MATVLTAQSPQFLRSRVKPPQSSAIAPSPLGGAPRTGLRPDMFATVQPRASGGGLGAVRQLAADTGAIGSSHRSPFGDLASNSPLRSRAGPAPTPAPRLQPLRTFATSAKVGVGASLDTGLRRGSNVTTQTLLPPLTLPATDGPRSHVTIVFDLDETLCSNRTAGRAILRPGATDLLNALAAERSANFHVEIVLWTASTEPVARPVLARLDPSGSIFDHAIFRDRRWYREFNYTKDLRRLGRELSRVVIVENSPQSVYLNPQHAVLVRDFTGSSMDKELLAVRDLLVGYCQCNKARLEEVASSFDSVPAAAEVTAAGPTTPSSTQRRLIDAVNSAEFIAQHAGALRPGAHGGAAAMVGTRITPKFAPRSRSIPLRRSGGVML